MSHITSKQEDKPSEFIHYTLKKAGNVVTFTTYQPKLKRPTNDRRRGKKKKEGMRTTRSLARSRRILTDTILCNVSFSQSRFLTLTFSKKVEKELEADLYFRLYVRRFNEYRRGKFLDPLKYTAVKERHKSGGFHWHMVVYNWHHIDFEVHDGLWGQGSVAVKIEFIKSLESSAFYLAKYLTKDFASLGLNKKLFINSRGLTKPLVLDNLKALERHRFFQEKSVELLTQLTLEGGIKIVKYRIL